MKDNPQRAGCAADKQYCGYLTEIMIQEESFGKMGITLKEP